MFKLDHLAISCTDLAQGRTKIEALLGLPFQTGGQHAYYGTHNLLMGMEDGLYLELIAIDPSARKQTKGPRWFGLDHFTGPPRLSNWLCSCADLTKALTISPPEAGQEVPLQRGYVRWKIAVPPDGGLPYGGAWPSLIEWDKDSAHPTQILTPQPVALQKITVTHPLADKIEQALGGLLHDGRFTLQKGAQITLSATFKTPKGQVTL